MSDRKKEAAPAAEAVEEQREVQPASEGAGPLLQRDYWAVIEGSEWTPEQVIQAVLTDFGRFCPEEIATVTRPEGRTAPLVVDDDLEVDLKGCGPCRVRVVHVDERSFTMRTLEGHPEAGRITFGATRHEDGHLVFRIRSRARASDTVRYLGYMLFGKGIQTRCWLAFIERVAEVCEGRIVGKVQTETKEDSDRMADLGELDTPTFVAA
jgi:uncharacterized protein DUF1990